MYISEVIDSLLEDYTPAEIAEILEVTTALVSTWKKKENDFTPRVALAAKIYINFGMVTWPYDRDALIEVAQHDSICPSNRHC